MKTRNDDFSNSVHAEEHNVSGTFTFKGEDGNYYRLDLDFSPSSFIKVVANSSIRKPLPWGQYIKHKTDEEKAKYNGRAGHYEPAKNVTQIIASLIEEKVEQ